MESETHVGARSRRRRLLRLVIAGMLAGLLLSACGSESPGELPNSSGTVDSDHPLTMDQATSVRADGRSLMESIIDAVDTAGLRPLEDGAWERWSGCNAKNGPLDFGPNNNGVTYVADITFGPEGRSVTEQEVQALLGALPISWKDSDTSTGTSGIYAVDISDTSPPRIQLFSPCYYLQDADDSGSIDTSAKHAVTGFSSRAWDE